MKRIIRTFKTPMEEMPALGRKYIDQQEKKSCSGDEASKSKIVVTLSRSQASLDWKPSQKDEIADQEWRDAGRKPFSPDSPKRVQRRREVIDWPIRKTTNTGFAVWHI